MKQIIITIAIILILPLWVQAAMLAPAKLNPLQPIPPDTAPNVKSNTNTPGNEYNTSQQQMQDQLPESTPETAGEAPAPIVSNSVPDQFDTSFYIILISICSLGLLLMFAWVFYRYRVQK